MNAFKLEIVTPERIFYNGTAESLILNTPDGQLGVLYGHEPMVATLEASELTVKINGENRVAVCTGGFLEMLGEQAYIFVQSIEWLEEIDVARAEIALARAKRFARASAISADNIYDRQRFLWALERAETRLKAVEHRQQNGNEK